MYFSGAHEIELFKNCLREVGQRGVKRGGENV